MRLLPASGYTIQRWKNGGGTTAEVAVHPEGAGLDDFEWRVSMATMTTDGPFSAYPGIARVLAILEGSGILLSGKSFGDQTLTRQAPPFAFDGGEAVNCRLLDGSTTDLNLMSRAGHYHRAMQRLSITSTVRLETTSSTRLILLTAGAIAVSDGSATLILSLFDAVRAESAPALELSAAEPSVAFLLTITELG